MRILVNGVMYLLFLVSVEVDKNAILVCLIYQSGKCSLSSTPPCYYLC